jgi:2-amino-4-hydroxy-6-hydroxymethyldihydropteridine diphosphokinase
MKKIPSAIALGSNLGNSQQILLDAVEAIASTKQIKLIACSNWHQTKPIGPPQPDYINGCAIINTSLTPEKLLQCLLDIEQQFGRERKIRWGARTLDLDLILYGDLILNTPHLQIPHPRMRERPFVLIPLAEIAPDWVEPVTGLTIAQLKTNHDD